MVFFGSWNALRVVTILAVWAGTIFGAVYMLRAVRAIFQGPVAAQWDEVRDAADPWRRLPFALLLFVLLLFGMVPRFLTDKIEPSAALVVRAVTAPAGAGVQAGLPTGQPDRGRAVPAPHLMVRK